MAASLRNRGRPRQEIASTILAELSRQPSTIREVALRHQISIRAARWAAHRLARTGLIRAHGTVPTGRRPATVYCYATCDVLTLPLFPKT